MRKANEEVRAPKEELKKSNEEREEMKKKMADKDAINKVHMERMGKLKQKIIKLKEKAKKLHTKLKQTKTELKEARDGALSLIEENS